jgi:hypothetical protein
MDFPSLVGFIVFAQPADRSRPVLPYVCVNQEGQSLEVLVTTGGILSSQTEHVHFYNSDRGWTLIGYQVGNSAMHCILAELTAVLENPELVLTDEARHEAEHTRQYLLEALAFRMRQQRLEAREAEDARLAAARTKEDEEFDATVQAAAKNPSPPSDTFAERPFGTGVDIDVVIRAPNVELLEATKDRLRKALRGANFNF